MRRKVFVLRYGAYGDLLYILPVIGRLHAAGDEIYLHTGNRGIEIFIHDPRIAEKQFHEPLTEKPEHTGNVLKTLLEKVQPDVFLNLSETIETLIIPRKGDPMFDWTIEHRRAMNAGLSFYDYPMMIAELPRMKGECGTMAFTDREALWVETWRKSHRNDFVVLMCLAGSTFQKRFPQQREIAQYIIDCYPDAHLYLTADKETLERFPGIDGRGRSYVMKGAPFRQALLMARYADYVIGPETGLLVGAGMWGTPKTMLCTTSSVHQCTDGHRKDLSLQAEISCSPCMRAIYEEGDCYIPLHQGATLCNFKFDTEKIKRGIEHVYQTMRYRWDADGILRTPFIRVPDVPVNFDRLPLQAGDLRQGVPG